MILRRWRGFSWCSSWCSYSRLAEVVLLGTSPSLRTQTRPAIEFVSGEEGLRPKSHIFVYSFLEYVFTISLKYEEAPGPHCGGRGEMAVSSLRRNVVRLLCSTSDAVLSLSCSVHEEEGYGLDVPPVGSYVRPPSVPVLYAVCCVTFKGSPSCNKYWSGLHPRLEGRGADSCRSDGRAIAAWHKRGHGHAREGR